METKLDFSNPQVQQDLADFGRRTFEKIMKNFKTLEIGIYNPNNKRTKRSTGALERSVFWKVYNESGGNMAKVTFFFNHYAVFVETGTGAGVKWSPLPELTELIGLKRPKTKRVAKPFLMSEIRLHARMTLEKLAEHFAYLGGVTIMNMVHSRPEGATENQIEEIYLNSLKGLK